MSKIVLRGGPFCGEEFRNRQLPETLRMPTVPAPLSYDPTPDVHLPIAPSTVDYRRTGLRSASGAYVYDWTGLNWGPLDESMAA